MRRGIPIALISTLLSLGLVEVALRVIGFSYHLYPDRIEFGAPDPVAMSRDYFPDRELFWVTGDYPQKLARLRTAAPAVVFMGDSCTQFGDYPRRTMHWIEANTGSAVPFESLGTAGWSTYQGLRQFQRDVVPLRPRLVTVFYGWNDHWYGFGIEDKDVARIRSRLFTVLDSLRIIQLATKAVIARSGREHPARPLRVSLPDFRSNLRQMAVLAHKNGIPLVFLTAPSSHEQGHEPTLLKLRWIDNLADLIPLHQSYVDAVRQIASEENVFLCDLARDFQNLSQEERNRCFLDDGIHFTAEGNHQVAKFLFECLSQNGLVERLAHPR